MKIGVEQIMANTSSAKKKIRVIERRRVFNKARLAKIRTYVKNVEDSIEDKDNETVLKAFKEAQPLVHSGVSKGVINKKAAARKISRLNRKIKNFSNK
tara:strand:+ start:616 stop:909 length:294 start_codon:yes stop_codon:yes gene_type:complete